MKVPARVVVGNVAAKWVGHCWEVGVVVPRVVHGKATEAIRGPVFVPTAHLALMTARLLLREQRDEHGEDAKLAEALEAIFGRKSSVEGLILEGPAILRVLRLEGGFSGRGLARAAGVTHSAIQEIEAGRSDPKASTVRKLSEALLTGSGGR